MIILFYFSFYSSFSFYSFSFYSIFFLKQNFSHSLFSFLSFFPLSLLSLSSKQKNGWKTALSIAACVTHFEERGFINGSKILRKLRELLLRSFISNYQMFFFFFNLIYFFFLLFSLFSPLFPFSMI